MGRRIIIYPPGHPMLMFSYILLSLALAFLASSVVAQALGPGSTLLADLVALLVLLSPAMSFVNIILGEVEGDEVLELDIEFTLVYGLPVPVPRVKYTRRRTVIALNIGGALIPVIVSGILLAVVYMEVGAELLEAAAVSTLATAAATFAASRTIPGVGIVVPALLPPAVSSIAAILYLGQPGPAAGVAAFAGGALGSLIGADVIRLYLDLRRLSAPLVSIGGAGVFDGIYLSALLGFILAY